MQEWEQAFACLRKKAAWTKAMEQEVCAYLKGERQTFSDFSEALKGLTAFQQAVLRAVQKIPYGEVRTYKEIAIEIGKPKGAQAVGQALAKNPYPLVFPCHRVVGQGGALGGYQGGKTMKAALLAEEQTKKL